MAPKFTFREQLEGFPFSQILIIALVRVAEPIAFTSLFTYVFFMVRDFDIAESEADVSKYAGYLASSFALSQALSSFNWGRFADKYGRKPTIVLGLTGSTLSILLFGFAKNYWWALFARALMGLLNGNIGVIRTMIGEVATEKHHQSLAFATTPFAYQVGAIIGPLIGGYTATLKETRFKSLNALIKEYPYALPNLCVGALLFTSAIIALLFLEDTHYKYKDRRDYFVEFGDTMKRLVSITPKERSWNKIDEIESVGLLSEGSSETMPLSRSPSKDYSSERTFEAESDDHSVGLKDILTPHLIVIIFSMMSISIMGTVYSEFFPVYLAYDVAKSSDGSLLSQFPFKLLGGLGYTPEDSGKVLSVSGSFGVIFVVFLLPQLTRRYEPLHIYSTFITAFPLIYFLVPYVVLLADHPNLARYCIYASSCFRTLITTMAFPQLLVVINAVAQPRHRAQINGALITVQASARCIAPLVWGYLMAWGQKYEIAWLGWWLCSAMGVAIVFQSRKLRGIDM